MGDSTFEVIYVTALTQSKKLIFRFSISVICRPLNVHLILHSGQHNDARMNVSIALTAISHGAVVSNHVEVTRLLKDKDGKVNGAAVRDTLTGDEWEIKAKGVINATGAFTGKYSHIAYCLSTSKSTCTLDANKEIIGYDRQ